MCLAKNHSVEQKLMRLLLHDLHHILQEDTLLHSLGLS